MAATATARQEPVNLLALRLNGSTTVNNKSLGTEIVALLKYLSNFWRSLNFYIINRKIELDLSWSKYSIISEISRTLSTAVDTPTPVEPSMSTTEAKFQKSSMKRYVQVVTLSINGNIKF